MDGVEVWLDLDPTQGRADRYGRLLSYVWLDETTMVNEVLVREGFAHEYTYDADYKYRELFMADQDAAEAGAVGLWAASTCGGDTEDAAN
ncbi:hypothetical protein AGMMS50218_11880 [Actinomycetota bacterium]|nr:hypothetical protein AGMMS50218_11880 [Actinomycetota bacterium]